MLETQTAIQNPAMANVLPAEARRADMSLQPLHNSTVLLATDRPIYDNHEIGLLPQNPLDTMSVVAEVNLNDSVATGAELAIVKTRYGQRDVIYAAGITRDEQGRTTVMPMSYWAQLQEDVPLTIGRNKAVAGENNVDGLQLFGRDFNTGISGRHVQLSLKYGQLEVNDISTNGSEYRGVSLSKEDAYDYSSSHTMTAEQAARLRGMLKENGIGKRKEFQGRPVIDRDTFPIDGHVDIRSWVGGGEAIVVDSKKYPKEFMELRAAFDRKLETGKKEGFFGRNRNKAPNDLDVVKAIYETVDEAMKYDLAFVDEESERVKGEVPDHRKAALNNYLMEGKGVCRHMALAVSWLGGDAVERGLIKGRFTTEVNQSTNGNGAHEWSRFVSDASENDVLIIDVAQHFVGKLADTLNRKARGVEYWGYFRSKEERDSYQQRKHGGVLIQGAGAVATDRNRIITEDDIPQG